MSIVILWSLFLLSLAIPGSPGTTAQKLKSADGLTEEIIALERSALDLWLTGDPQGYLDLYAPEVTYFDPNQEKRIDGLEAMKSRFSGVKSPITDPRYEMVGAKLQRHGEVALLTFNLISYGKLPGQSETVLARWNSTEVYSRINGKWKIIHSHWSYIKPEVKNPVL